MFKVKIVAVLLTAFLAIGGFISTSPATAYSKKKFISKDWWLYDGVGFVYDPASYTYLGSDPGCSSSTALCAIKVETDIYPSRHIVTSSFNSLKLESNTFSAAGAYIHGEVERFDP